MRYLFVFVSLLIFHASVIADETRLEKVRLQLQWKHQFEFAGFYAAMEKGYYRDAGLDVELLEFESGVDIVKDVVEGKAEYGVSGAQLLIRYLKNDPVVLLANIFKHSPKAIAAHPDIKTPADLAGKTVMGISQADDQHILQVMLGNFNVSVEDLKVVKPSFTIDDFAEGKVDALVVFTTNEVYQLDKRGIEYNLFDPGNYVSEYYDVNLFTSQKELQNNPDRVKAFREASIKGWLYALQNQSEIINLILEKYNTQNKTYEALEYEAAEIVNLVNPLRYPIGSIDRNHLESIKQFYFKTGRIPADTDADFNDFIYARKSDVSSLTDEEYQYLKLKRVVTFCADPDWMPFERIVNGKHEGMAADYFSLIAERLGTELELVPTSSWDQSLDFARQRKCDLFSLAMETPERSVYMNFTEPYLSFPLVIANKINEDFINDIETVLDKPLGIVKGYAYAEILRDKYPDIKLVEYDSLKDGLLGVVENEVFGFVGSLATIGYQIQEQYIGELKIAGKFDEYWELGIGVRNDDVMLLSIFNKVIRSITPEQHQEFSNKWLSVKFEEVVDYTRLIQISAFFSVLIAVFLWNFHSQKKLVFELKRANKAISESENRYKTLFKGNKAVELLVDVETQEIVDANNSAVEFYGYGLDELKQKKITDINQMPETEIHLEKALARIESRSMFRFQHQLANGDIRDVHEYTGPITIDGRSLLYSIIFDVTETVKLEKDKEKTDRLLKESNEKLQVLFELSPLGITLNDMNGNFIDFNESFRKITGYSHDELMTMDYWDLTPKKYLHQEQQQLDSLHRSGYYGPYEKEYRCKDGKLIPINLNGMLLKDSKGVSYIWSIVEDITDKKAQTDALEHSARHDALTGLPNRFLLSHLMRQAMKVAHRKKVLLAILFVDLDGFKEINDQYGHEVGDQVLQEISKRIKEIIRENDLVARLGGDEFVVGINELEDSQELIPILDRLLEDLASPIHHGSNVSKVSASIGISLFSWQDTVEPDTLIRQADKAMYEAKAQGKNCYRFFNIEADEEIRQQSVLLKEFEQGLNNGEIELFYQPRVHLGTGELVAVEALLRWRHPQKGLLMPDAFLSAMETSPDLMVRLGKKVFSLAFAQLNKWLEEDMILGVSLNVSAHELHSPDFIKLLKELFEQYPAISPNLVELEILETQALKDIEFVSATLTQCRNLGIKIAIDDFGTGYASLHYLNHFPMDLLKIDRSFVRHCLDSSKNLSIIDAAIGLGGAFRCSVVAEGVEKVQQGILLRQFGCEYVQGYCIAHPMQPEGLADWLQEWKMPEAWKNVDVIRKENRNIIYAEIEHRKWIEQIGNYLADKDESQFPEMNHHQCHLGHWIDNEADKNVRATVEFEHLNKLHEQLHARAAQVVMSNEDSSSAISELEEIRNRILKILKHFLH